MSCVVWSLAVNTATCQFFIVFFFFLNLFWWVLVSVKGKYNEKYFCEVTRTNFVEGFVIMLSRTGTQVRKFCGVAFASHNRFSSLSPTCRSGVLRLLFMQHHA